MKIKKVDAKEAINIIESKEPRGHFYYKMGRCYIGIDNNTGYSWTKRFKKYKLCKKWLLG